MKKIFLTQGRVIAVLWSVNTYMKRNPKLLPISESVFEGYNEDTAWAVHQAILNLLELVESIVVDGDPQEIEELYAEAKQTIGRLCAVVVFADGDYGADEHTLIVHLLDMGADAESEVSDLNEWSLDWEDRSKRVPRFFQLAVLRGGDARSMLREIQFIGNNVCISDGVFEGKERIVVSQYVAFLEDYLSSHVVE